MSAKGNLRRCRKDRVIAGVCCSLGDFFAISAIWFRLAFLILLLPGGLPGFVPYLVLWLVIPQE